VTSSSSQPHVSPSAAALSIRQNRRVDAGIRPSSSSKPCGAALERALLFKCFEHLEASSIGGGLEPIAIAQGLASSLSRDDSNAPLLAAASRSQLPDVCEANSLPIS
jgi:hypothetical protein